MVTLWYSRQDSGHSNFSYGHPNQMLRFPSPDRPIFEKVEKKIQNQKKQTLKFTSTPSCLIYTNCLKLSILRFCCLFRHLIVLLIYIFYHLTVSCRLKIWKSRPAFTGTQTPLCVHSFFLLARPTDPPSREGGRLETKHFLGMALLKRG